jgi:hypothetical protein
MSNVALVVASAVALFAAMLLGTRVRRLVPEQHLTADSKDAVKVATGLVATMTALLLGLLLSSSKSTFDGERNEVVEMAAKVTFLDRVLELYGPEASDVRTKLRDAVADMVRRMWPDDAGVPGEARPDVRAGDAVYAALQHLAPHDDAQRDLKANAMAAMADLAQLRALLLAQSLPSVSKALLLAVIAWLVLIFASFGFLMPRNGTTMLAMLAADAAVVLAIFFILELDTPLGGTIRIPPAPMLATLAQLAK